MQRTYIADAQPGQKVRLSGFLENIRNKRAMAFLGLDRITMIALNIAIKEVMFLFRGPNRLTP